VQIDEWEAWLENPITRRIKAELQVRHDQYAEKKAGLHPRGFEDAHGFFAESLVLATRVESYLAIVNSLEIDAFEDIFEEET
jgi:hypothetical protein